MKGVEGVGALVVYDRHREESSFGDFCFMFEYRTTENKCYPLRSGTTLAHTHLIADTSTLSPPTHKYMCTCTSVHERTNYTNKEENTFDARKETAKAIISQDYQSYTSNIHRYAMLFMITFL